MFWSHCGEESAVLAQECRRDFSVLCEGCAKEVGDAESEDQACQVRCTMQKVVLHNSSRQVDGSFLNWVDKLGGQQEIWAEIGPAHSGWESAVRTGTHEAPILMPTGGSDEIWVWAGEKQPTLSLRTTAASEIAVRIVGRRWSVWATAPPIELVGEACFKPSSGLQGTSSLPLTKDGKTAGMITIAVYILFDGIVRPMPATVDSLAEEPVDPAKTFAQRKAALPNGKRSVFDQDAPTETLQGLRLVLHTAAITCCAAFPISQRILIGSKDKTASIWSNDGRRLVLLSGHTSPLIACCVFPTESLVLTTSETGGIIWSVKGELLVTLPDIRSCVLFPHGDRFLSVLGQSTEAAIFQTDGKRLSKLSGHAGHITACATFPCGGRVLTVARDGDGIIWSAQGEKLRTLCGHTAGITCCAIFPDGYRVVTGSEDTTSSIWLSTGSAWEFGKRLTTLQGHSGTVSSCTLVQSGRMVVTSSDDGRCMLWSDVGECMYIFSGHSYSISVCAALGSGEQILTCSRDGVGIVWECGGRRLGRQRFHLESHSTNIRACAVLSSGNQLVTVGDDRIGMVWDLTGREWPPQEMLPHSCELEARPQVGMNVVGPGGQLSAENSLVMEASRPLREPNKEAYELSKEAWNESEKNSQLLRQQLATPRVATGDMVQVTETPRRAVESATLGETVARDHKSLPRLSEEDDVQHRAQLPPPVVQHQYLPMASAKRAPVQEFVYIPEQGSM